MNSLIKKIETTWKRRKEIAYLGYLQLKLNQSGAEKFIAIYLSLPMHYNFVKNLISDLQANQYNVFVFVTDNSLEVFQKISNKRFTVLNSFILKHLPFKLVITPASGFGKTSYCHEKSYKAHFFHSIVSAHVVYKHQSFMGYDFLFCAGPHHVEEVKALYQLNRKPQYLIDYGYEITDRLIAASQNKAPETTQTKTVLFGPSWGVQNSLRKHGVQIIKELLDQKYQVILRPHPISFSLDANVIDEIKKKFKKHLNFQLDQSVDSTNSLLSADVMISDYSGVAFEYALALLKPVIFMNGLRKQNNKNWQDYLDREGVEVIYRDRIGYILDDMAGLIQKVEQALREQDVWKDKIRQVRKELLFNEGNCTQAAIQAIDKIYTENFETFTTLSH